MQITMTKQALIDKLNEQLALAKIEDVRIEKEHKLDEQKALKEFRAQLREAMKWDYHRAKKCNRYSGDEVVLRAPSCPTRNAVPIASVLRMVQYSTSKTFAIKSDSDIARALEWVPASERVGRTVCDE